MKHPGATNRALRAFAVVAGAALTVAVAPTVNAGEQWTPVNKNNYTQVQALTAAALKNGATTHITFTPSNGTPLTVQSDTTGASLISHGQASYYREATGTCFEQSWRAGWVTASCDNLTEIGKLITQLSLGAKNPNATAWNGTTLTLTYGKVTCTVREKYTDNGTVLRSVARTACNDGYKLTTRMTVTRGATLPNPTLKEAGA